MKYDLLITDVVAWVTGVFGLLASMIFLNKALLNLQFGNPAVGLGFCAFALFILLFSRHFVLTKTFDRLLLSAKPLRGRVVFGLLSLIWLCLLWMTFSGTQPTELLGFGRFLQTPFLWPLFVGFLFLYAMVFLFPGFAYWRIEDSTEPATGQLPETPWGAGTSVQKRPSLFNAKANRNFIKSTVPLNPSPFGRALYKVSNVLFCGLMIVTGYYFFTTHTFASLNYVDKAKPILYFMTFFFFLFIYLPYNYGIRIVPSTGQVLFKPRRKIVNAFFAMLMAYGMALLPYFYLIPSAYNELGETEKAEVVYVVEGSTSYKGCRRGVTFHYPEQPKRTFDLCHLPSDMRAQLLPGMPVIIGGRKSYYGHTADYLRLPLKEVGV